MEYKKLTIHEKINYKDYFKEYCIKDNMLKEDKNNFSIKLAKNIFYGKNTTTILEADSFIQGYGILQPYLR